jgi:Spy/CpxP family protein refolding chaperone
MKQVWYGAVLALALLFVFDEAALGQRRTMREGQMARPGRAAEPVPGDPAAMGPGAMAGEMGLMGPQMMGMMPGMPAWIAMGQPSQMVRRLQTELGLSADQAGRIKEIFLQARRAMIKQGADIRLAELDLQELLAADQVDMGNVEGKLKAVEGLRTTLRLTLIKAHEEAKGVLTPEQRQKFRELHDRLPGMMGGGVMGQHRGGMGGETGRMSPQRRR